MKQLCLKVQARGQVSKGNSNTDLLDEVVSRMISLRHFHKNRIEVLCGVTVVMSHFVYFLLTIFFSMLFDEGRHLTSLNLMLPLFSIK